MNNENQNQPLEATSCETRGILPKETISTNAGLCSPNSQRNDTNLKELCIEMRELRAERDRYSKMFEAKKEEFRKICEERGIDSYKDEDISARIVDVDKSYLDEEPTLRMLRDKKLEKYIHTKEYFNYEELMMAVTKKEIPAEELKQFMIEKHEKRVNIR